MKRVLEAVRMAHGYAYAAVVMTLAVTYYMTIGRKELQANKK